MHILFWKSTFFTGSPTNSLPDERIRELVAAELGTDGVTIEFLHRLETEHSPVYSSFVLRQPTVIAKVRDDTGRILLRLATATLRTTFIFVSLFGQLILHHPNRYQ